MVWQLYYKIYNLEKEKRKAVFPPGLAGCSTRGADSSCRLSGPVAAGLPDVGCWGPGCPGLPLGWAASQAQECLRQGGGGCVCAGASRAGERPSPLPPTLHRLAPLTAQQKGESRRLLYGGRLHHNAAAACWASGAVGAPAGTCRQAAWRE